MGITVYVLRSPDLGDCTLNGLSSRYTELCVVNAEGPAKPSKRAPAVVLEMHVKGCLRIVPDYMLRPGGKPEYFMMGGNFGHSSDSRFTELCEKLLGHRFYGAVAIHDRVE